VGGLLLGLAAAVAIGFALASWQATRMPRRLAGLSLLAMGMLSGALDRPPDLLVSGDGRLIALRAGEALFLQSQSGASAFVREDWQRMHGAGRTEALPREGEAADGALRCRAGACALRPDPAGPEAVPLRGACLAQVVDRLALWRDGPHAIWLLRTGARVISDRAWRGDRPWVPPVPAPRGLASAAPAAAAE
jgi:competence protein ComEC